MVIRGYSRVVGSENTVQGSKESEQDTHSEILSVLKLRTFFDINLKETFYVFVSPFVSTSIKFILVFVLCRLYIYYLFYLS